MASTISEQLFVKIEFRDDQTQLINDTELNTALKEHNDFFAQYDGRVSGADANRFGINS